MQEQLSQIDTACADALKALKDEQDVLDGRIRSMDEMKSSVAEAVYLRVRADYVAKREALEAQARPLRETARAEYARLQAIVAELEAAIEAINLDRQELELRHQLGEFDKKEYEARLQAIDAGAAEKTGLSGQAAALRERFLAAVRSETELLLPEPPAKKAATAAKPASPAATTEQIPQAAVTAAAQPAAQVTAEIPALAPAPAPATATEGTLVMPAIPPKPAAKPAPAPAAAIVSEATVMFRPARLVPQNPEAGKATHALTLKPLAIGSDQANDVRIGGPGVEPRHATISPTPQGYVITDLDTKHGTRVNNEKIKTKLLGNEDVVQVGAARFVFRAS